MPNVVKSHGVLLNSEPVKIEDIAPLLPGLDLPPEESAEGFVTLDENGMPVLAKVHEGLSSSRENGNEPQEPHPMQTEIIQGAMAEASRIVEEAVRDAEEKRAEILAKAQLEAERMRNEACDTGQQEGFTTVVKDVHAVVEKVELALADLEGDVAGFQGEYEEQLRWFSAEIASKVLSEKMAEDDTILVAMVEKVVRGLKNEAWVRVEVAQEMVGLIEKLTKLYAQHGNVDISSTSMEAGTIRVETPAGIVDTSVQTQLKNIKEYFGKIK